MDLGSFCLEFMISKKTNLDSNFLFNQIDGVSVDFNPLEVTRLLKLCKLLQDTKYSKHWIFFLIKEMIYADEALEYISSTVK